MATKKNTPKIAIKKDIKFPKFKNDKLDKLVFPGFANFNPITYRIPKSRIRIREKKFEILNITELSNSGQNIYFVEIFDTKYLKDIELFVKKNNHKFDRTIEIDSETYKVDLNNKFAIKYKSESIHSVSIVIENF